MKLFLAYLCTAIFVISPERVFSAVVLETATVESIRFMGERDGGEVIHFKLNKKLEPKVFELLGKNPRVVFDFHETGYSIKEKRIIKVGGKLIKKIRVGMHHQPVEKTRVVIDLTSDKEFEVIKEFSLSEMVLEVRIFLKTADLKSKSAVAEQKREKEEKLQKPMVVKDLERDNTAPPSAKVVDSVKQEESAKAIEKVQAETVSAQKSTAGVDRTPDMSGSLGTKNQIGGSEKADLAKAEEAPILINVSYENTTNNKEMVLFQMSGFYPPVVFAIEEDEPRIVCDFLDVQLGVETKQVLNSKGQYIRKVRVAKHSNPDKVRVVLDLVADNDYDLKQVFFKEDNLFVVIISTL